ncbi:MAG: GNAT family N-acetyltransferase, partial [Pseudomonadota bacterium]
MQAPPVLPQPFETEAVWHWCAFDALTVRELYNIYRARQQVFVLDQGSLYADADACDAHSHHLAAWSALQELPLAYARVLAPGVKYTEPAIGRVLTLPAVRGQGWGRRLMQRALAEAAQLY